ncbi:hypothetical protein GCM10022240_04670 [Microbacterium kribbense]|uniref:Plasmid pRiA4b Orf3-like domain-containing protein n=1 Tax=Microbacterium kribbense TaxID=433645 RepID=A0ABP7G9A1_9MICO
MADDRTEPTMLRLRAGLQGSDPEIWREVETGDWLTLAQLHDVLQIAFGWQQAHLHRFSDEDPWASPGRGIPRIGRQPRAWVDQWSLLESGGEAGEADEADATLAEAFRDGGPLWYEYDLGDGWMHRIDLVATRAAPPGTAPVRLVDGARRAPFEDSGGLGGYAEKLAIMADPGHPEHNEILGWARSVAGPWGSIDPEQIDLDGARADLELLTGPATPDMSGLVDAARDIDDDAPIVGFAANLPVPYRANLRAHLRTSGVLDPVTLTDDEAAELVRPYHWLMERIGDDGLALTAAGRLPPALVRAAVAELDWGSLVYGQTDREDNTWPVHLLRTTAERLRLVRKVKGRLVLAARTRALRDDPQALCRQVAHVLLRQRMDEAQQLACTTFVLGIADGSISRQDDGAALVFEIVNGFGYTDEQGMPLDKRWYFALTEPARSVLNTLGLRRSPLDASAAPSDALRRFARLALR